MASFSERYGYTKPSDVIIREKITPEIQNAICSCYDRLYDTMGQSSIYWCMEEYLWTNFLHNRKRDFKSYLVAVGFINNTLNKWFSKLDLIEMSIKYLYDVSVSDFRPDLRDTTNAFVQNLNREFKRLNFAYRVIDMEIAEITSEEEIVAIEEALRDSKNNIKDHLNKALKQYAQKPVGEYSSSIKDSISAVEAFCREKTGADTLGKALNKLESNGVTMPEILKTAFHKLYAYTNDPVTGIRHALMDDKGSYVPQAEEALFMLVSCSAFINYLNKKAE